MNKLFCVRHGKTIYNVDNLTQGSHDIPLNEIGIDQAINLGNTIDLSNIDFCICSPLIRAKTTAELIVQGRIPIYEDSLLVERSFGNLEGTKIPEDVSKSHWDYKLNTKKDGIEPIQDFIARVNTFLDKINENYDNKNILIVSHGCFIKIINFCINGYDENTNFYSFLPDNCKVYSYELDRPKTRIKTKN